MEYFNDGFWKPTGDGKCADRDCTCQQGPIKRGEGYLYVSREVSDFRYMFRSHEAAVAEMERMIREKYGRPVKYESRFGPVLLCRIAASWKKVDLDIAAADARHWWETGKSPLRTTPQAGSQAARLEKLERSDIKK